MRAHRYAGRCTAMSADTRALLQHALQWTPSALTRLKAGGRVRAELEAAIEAYITVVAGKPLPSMDFMTAPPAGASWVQIVRPVVQSAGVRYSVDSHRQSRLGDDMSTAALEPERHGVVGQRGAGHRME